MKKSGIKRVTLSMVQPLFVEQSIPFSATRSQARSREGADKAESG